MVEQTLEVRGDQDVHRRRGRLVEGAAGVIGAGAQEVGQNVVLVGRADQPAHGQTHLLGVVARQNVPEVAGGHTEIHGLAPFDCALLGQTEVGVEVVDDLRHEAAPVDGVGAGQADAALFQLGGDVGVGKDLLDAGLGIVKVALHGVDLHIFSLLGRHLQMLDLACAVVRVKYLNFNAVEVGVARQRGLAGVAGGCHQNAGRLGAAQHLLGLDEQLRHELQGVVLEGAGRAVPQLERIQAVADLDGLARLAAKGSAVGRCRCGVQEISAVIGQKTGQDLFGQLGIGEIFPCVQISLGEGLRHEQTALRCQAADDSLLCGNAECGISGAQILHTFTPFLLFSFLYMYKPFWRYTLYTVQAHFVGASIARPCPSAEAIP